MEYDYYAVDPFTVYDLVNALMKIVASNPDIDFHKVSVGMNCEYGCSGAVLGKWIYNGKQRVAIDLEP